MPCGDGTGPMGMGPMTGRRAGLCAGYSYPGYAGHVPYGFGHRGIRRRYFRHGSANWNKSPYMGIGPVQAFDEREYLMNQAEFLEKELQEIKARLDKIQDKKE